MVRKPLLVSSSWYFILHKLRQKTDVDRNVVLETVRDQLKTLEIVLLRKEILLKILPLKFGIVCGLSAKINGEFDDKIKISTLLECIFQNRIEEAFIGMLKILRRQTEKKNDARISDDAIDAFVDGILNLLLNLM